MNWAIIALIVFIAYLIGSIPTGYILVKALKGIDIRTVGSGSTGATNVKRILGTKYFVVVMLLDMFKGLIPIIALGILAAKTTLIPTVLPVDIISILAGIALVIGHSKSIYLKFTGGKSVAISVGILFGLSWKTALLAVIVWIIIVYFTRYVSLGSIVASFTTPLGMWLFDAPLSYLIFTLMIAFYVSLYLHRENIKRLIEGNENKFSLKGEKS